MRFFGPLLFVVLGACFLLGPRDYRNSEGGGMLVVMFLVVIEELSRIEEEGRKKP